MADDAQLRAWRLVVPGSTGLDDGEHPTGNLESYVALDIHGVPGAIVTAPEDVTVERVSGRDPAQGAGGNIGGRGGSFGWSEYLRGDKTGTRYYLTHFGSTSVRQGQHWPAGTILGTVGDYPNSAADHIHFGTKLPNHPQAVLDALLSGGAVPAGESPGGPALGIPNAVGGAVGSVTGAVGDAFGLVSKVVAFVFSVRFLEIVGGGVLVVIALNRLLKGAGIDIPGSVAKGVAATRGGGAGAAAAV